MLRLRAHLGFHFREHLKMHKDVKKKKHFMLQLMIPLAVQSRSAPKGTLEGVPKDALSYLYKDAEEGAFEAALKGALEVALEFHLWLHLLMQSLMQKFVQNVFSNGRPDAALEGALDSGLNDGLEGAPWRSL